MKKGLLLIMIIILFSCQKQKETVPTLTTSDVTNIKLTTAICGGNITDEGSGTILTRGVCWSTGNTPTLADSKTIDGSGAGNFTSNMNNLNADTKYYVRAYATSSTGTGYGMAMSFNTLMSSVKDYDGNIYKTIQIGTQIWMAENLKTTKYNDGTTIPNVNITDANAWNALSSGTRGTDPNIVNCAAIYGWYYNWYAVVSNRKICPTGWHIPSDTEWTNLSTYLGGENNAGGKLKEAGTTHWLNPNTGATNETGFTALPAGGTQAIVGEIGIWWSSTDGSSSGYPYDGFERILGYNGSYIVRASSSQHNGFSVRCLKD